MHKNYVTTEHSQTVRQSRDNKNQTLFLISFILMREAQVWFWFACIFTFNASHKIYVIFGCQRHFKVPFLTKGVYLKKKIMHDKEKSCKKVFHNVIVRWQNYFWTGPIPGGAQIDRAAKVLIPRGTHCVQHRSVTLLYFQNIVSFSFI